MIDSREKMLEIMKGFDFLIDQNELNKKIGQAEKNYIRLQLEKSRDAVENMRHFIICKEREKEK